MASWGRGLYKEKKKKGKKMKKKKTPQNQNTPTYPTPPKHNLLPLTAFKKAVHLNVILAAAAGNWMYWSTKSLKCSTLRTAPTSFPGSTTETHEVQGESIRHSALCCQNAFNVINQRLAFFIFPHDWAYICRAFKSPQFQYFRMTKAELAIGNYCMVD